jgi:hypothetical protein
VDIDGESAKRRGSSLLDINIGPCYKMPPGEEKTASRELGLRKGASRVVTGVSPDSPAAQAMDQVGDVSTMTR